MPNQRIISGVIETQGLKHAPDPMSHMKSKASHGCNIEYCYRPRLESRDYVSINTFRFEVRVRRMNRAERKMQQVVNHEKRDDGSAPKHRARRVTRVSVFVALVGHMPGRSVPNRELRCGQDVKADRANKGDSGGPEELWRSLQQLCPSVEGFRTCEDLEVSGQVPNDEPEKDGIYALN